MARVEEGLSSHSCIHPDSNYLVSQRPKIDRLYAVISAAICAYLPASYIVLRFHVPNSVVALGVIRGSASWLLFSFPCDVSYRYPRRPLLLPK